MENIKIEQATFEDIKACYNPMDNTDSNQYSLADFIKVYGHKSKEPYDIMWLLINEKFINDDEFINFIDWSKASVNRIKEPYLQVFENFVSEPSMENRENALKIIFSMHNKYIQKPKKDIIQDIIDKLLSFL